MIDPELENVVEPVTVLALDIGGTKIAGGLVQIDGSPVVVANAETPTDAARGGVEVLRTVIRLARGLVAAADHPVVAIGVGAAGVVDIATGAITSATNLIPGWAGIRLGEELEAATGLPVSVIGDVAAHGLGEHLFGAAQGAGSTLVVGVGTGIGGAFVNEGRVLTGSRGVGGHVGHVSSCEASGLQCSCGRRGHLEPVASGTAIASQFNQRTGKSLTGREVAELAEVGDATATSVVMTAGLALGKALASLANTLDPDVIVLSGSVTNAGPTWWRSVHEGYADQAMDPLQDVPIRRGNLGLNAPLLGAAAHVLGSAERKTERGSTD